MTRRRLTDDEREALKAGYMPTPEEIERMKLLIRQEKGETEPIPEKAVDWSVIQHLLNCEVSDDAEA